MKEIICSFNFDALVGAAVLAAHSQSKNDPWFLRIIRPDESSKVLEEVIHKEMIKETSFVGFQFSDPDLEMIRKSGVGYKDLSVIDFRSLKSGKKFPFLRQEDGFGSAQIAIRALKRTFSWENEDLSTLADVASPHLRRNISLESRKDSIYANAFFDMFGPGIVTMLATNPSEWRSNKYSAASAEETLKEAENANGKMIPIGQGIFVIPGKHHGVAALSIIGEKAFADDACEMIVTMEKSRNEINFSALSKNRKCVGLLSQIRSKFKYVPGTSSPDLCVGRVQVSECPSETHFVSTLSSVWERVTPIPVVRKSDKKETEIHEEEEHLCSSIAEILQSK